jgi:hypothetical protein
MKTLLITILFSTTLLFAAQKSTEKTPVPQSNMHTEWVDAQIAAIKPPRKGMSSVKLSRVKNPYIVKYASSGKSGKAQKASTAKSSTAGMTTAVKTVRKPLKLTAILNETALIGNKWYDVNDKVHAYRIKKINKDSVVLSYGNKERILMLSKQNPKIKIQIK